MLPPPPPENEFARLAVPAAALAVGDTFIAPITVGGKPVDCTFTVLADGTVQIGKDGKDAAIKKETVGALTIPDSITYDDVTYLVTAIGNSTNNEGAFQGCRALTGDLTIPKGVTSIGKSAFQDCRALTGDLTIPKGVTTIGQSAFGGCSGFTGPLTIPEGVETIGNYAFEKCSGFTGPLTIPEGVETIGSNAFDGCSGFTGPLTISEGVETIGSSAFSGCSGFTGPLTIPEGVETIGNYAFGSCSGFTGPLTIPDGVTSIGNDAFNGCSALTTAIIEGNTPPTTIGTDVFIKCTDLTSIYVPAAALTAYQGITNLAAWKNKMKPMPETPTITTNLNTTEVTYTVGATANALDAAATVSDGGTITYAWYRNATGVINASDTAITDATTATYTPPTTTAGTTYYYCVVTNTNSVAPPQTATTTTSAVAHITVKATLTGTVAITGTLKFDETLTATVIGGNSSGTPSYQWKRGMADITTATASTYTTVEADIGKILTCVVTSADQAGSISGTTTAAIAKADGSITAPTAPSIDYTDEELATTTALEYEVDSGTWAACTANMLATAFGWDGNSAVDVQFRTPATATHEASAAVTVNIPVRPSAPPATDFTVVKPTTSGGSDGELSGITSAMEYKTGNATTYTGGGAALTGIADGTSYTIRTKATTSAFASKTVSVMVASKITANITFTDETVSYNGAEQIHENATVTGLTGGTMTYTYTANTGSALNTNSKPQNAGSYTVTATYVSTTHIGSATATLTINKANVTITADDKNVVVGEALPTYTATTTGLVGGETISTITFAGGPADSSAKGTHTITPSGGTITGGGTTNYTISYATGTLAIVLPTELIDIAIAGANAAKSGIAVNEKAPASVASGTKYVTSAEMTALTDAIATATTAKDTVNTAAGAQTAATALNDAVATFTGVIKTGTYSGGGSSGGGGGSGSGSSETPTEPPVAPPVAPPIETPIVTPPPTTPTAPEDVEVKVESKVDKDGNLTVNVENKDITDAIAKAKPTADGITVVLNISGSSTADSVKFNLPKTVQETIIKNKIVNTILVIDKPDIKISMDLSAIKEINAQAQDDVNIIVNRSDLQALSQEARTAIGNRPAFDFTVAYGNQLLVEDFKGGNVNVAISYTLASDEDEQNIKIVYIDDNGNLNWLDSTSYSAKNQTISFDTNHFSTFAVGDKSLAMPTDTAPEPPAIPAEAEPVNDTSIPLWVWIVAIAIGVAIFGGSRFYIRRTKY